MPSTTTTFAKPAWWKESVVYQIYPASFLDTTNSGWGDINGITSKLDYLNHLGVDVLWVSPIFTSPHKDMGYDISDYKDIDPRYGTLGDVDRLIEELGKRDMKLMMDLVVNHTSDQHAWFLESRSSLSNPKRNWYIWKKPRYDKDGVRHPPNNWSMILGEKNSAWTYDAETDEYFLALFTAEQPDLNWENPDVRAAVYDVMLFWLERGAAGFRMDVINLISKDQSFPDAKVVSPAHTYQPGHEFYANGPRLHEFLKEMHDKVLSRHDTITVGEMPFVRDDAEILKVVGSSAGELRMIFIFEIVDIDNGPGYRLTLKNWDAREIKRITNHWQRLMIDNDGWNSVFCENHDNPRSVSRYTDDSDEFRELGAKLLCLMQTTLGGTLYVFQGQELGMRNCPPTWSTEEYKDIESQNYWQKMQAMYPNDTEKLAYARHVLQRKARDHSRTPVQWTSEAHGGFCKPDVTPWMRVNDDYKTINAAVQRANTDPNQLSVLQFWKRGLENRKRHKGVFVYGDFRLLDEENPKIFAYLRTSDTDGIWIVVLNFSKHDVDWEIPEDVLKIQGWEVGNYHTGKPKKATTGKIRVLKWEGLLGRCTL